MNSLFRITILRLTLVSGIGFLIGDLFGKVALGVLVAVMGYLVVFLLNFRRFQSWMDSGFTSDRYNPMAISYWSSIKHQIERRFKLFEDEKIALYQDVEFFRDSFQALDSAVVVVDSKGLITWANQQSIKLLGIDIQKDKDRVLLNLLREPTFKSYFQEKDFSKLLKIDSPLSADVKLEIQISEFREGSSLIFARDITELVQLENVRRDFIANVSHELRTPLTVINGYLEMFKDMLGSAEDENAESVEKAQPVIPANFNRIFEQMLSQSQRMEGMVNDLLWLSRIESMPAPAQLEKVPVESLIRGIVQDAEIAAKNKQFTLEFDLPENSEFALPLCIAGSYEELRSAFNNLVNNAVKYTQENAEIQIRCFQQGDTYRVAVKDNGEGFDPVHIPRLTERFYRTDESRNSTTGGSGLGLAIVKHVLQRHSANLEIETAIGKGSKFTCVFPLDRLVQKEN